MIQIAFISKIELHNLTTTIESTALRFARASLHFGLSAAGELSVVPSRDIWLRVILTIMSTPSPMIRWAILGFAGTLNIVVALWLASLAHLFTYLTIGFNSHNQEPWFTTRDIVIIIGFDTISAFVVAFAASKVLLLINRVLKLSPKFASGLSNMVFISVGVTLVITFIQGFKGFM